MIRIDKTVQVDPEFYEEHIGNFPQKWIFGLPLLINGIAFWWDWRRIGTEKTKAS